MSSTHSIRKLGPWMLTALVAGNMIGSAVYYLPAVLASFGSISLVSWLFTTVGALLLALVFAQLSMVMPKIGGPYAYCREGFGEFIGFQMAYNYWIALWVGNAAIAVALAGYLSVFFPILHDNHMAAFLVNVSVVWLLTGVNIIGTHLAGVVQLITTVLKIIPLLLVGLVGLFFINPQHLTHFNMTQQSDFFAFSGAASLTLWAFIGLESATIPAESVDNPKRSIPRATIFGTLLAAVIYILSTISIMGLIPMDALANSTAPFADAASIIFGPLGKTLVAAGAAISCFGTLNGWILLQGQIPLAAAQDDLFPQQFSKVSRRSGTPVFGLVFTSLLVTGLLFMTIDKGLTEQFKFIILLAVLASLIPYLFTTMSAVLLYNKKPTSLKGKRLIASTVIAILACAYAFWAIIGSGQQIVFYGSLLFFSSVPVYVVMKYKNKLSNAFD